jgi:polyhydroxyalkanoate synthase
VPSIAPDDLIDRIGREVGRLKVRARNGLRQMGGVATGPVAVTPKSPVWQRDNVVLYRYESNTRAREAPILLVMSLITKPYVFDLRPGSSLVADLLGAGFDVYLLDWGIPGPADAYNSLRDLLRRVHPEGGPRGVTHVRRLPDIGARVLPRRAAVTARRGG